MTDNETIKALECCVSEDFVCSGCPYDTLEAQMVEYSEYDCVWYLRADALDLINRQQAEIDRLKAALKTDEEIIAELEEQNELEIVDGGASCHLCLKVHTDKAIKEFAEKLKTLFALEHLYGSDVIFNRIDLLVKEMVGADNG